MHVSHINTLTLRECIRNLSNIAKEMASVQKILLFRFFFGVNTDQYVWLLALPAKAIIKTSDQ